MIYRQEKINAREYKHFRRFGMLFLDRCGSQRSRPLRFSMVYSRGPVHLCLKSPKRLNDPTNCHFNNLNLCQCYSTQKFKLSLSKNNSSLEKYKDSLAFIHFFLTHQHLRMKCQICLSSLTSSITLQRTCQVQQESDKPEVAMLSI